MNFLELVQKRQSVREYSDQPVEKEKIARCLEAARLAPSACNSQPWHMVVIDDPTLRSKVAGGTFGPIAKFNRFAMNAPVLVLFLQEQPRLITRIGGILKRQPYPFYDLGIACAHFCLQVAEEGLGSCILGWFNAGKIKRIVGIPPHKRIALVVTVGYPTSGEIRPKIRKDPKEVISFNGYSR